MVFNKGIERGCLLVMIFIFALFMVGCSKHEHEFEIVSRIEANCTEDGELILKCTKCEETKKEPINKLGHSEVIDSMIEASCNKPGLTEGSHCNRCNTILIEQEEIVKEHEYEYNYIKTEEGEFLFIKSCINCEENTILVKLNVSLEEFTLVKVIADSGFIFQYEFLTNGDKSFKVETNNNENVTTSFYLSENEEVNDWYATYKFIGDGEESMYSAKGIRYFKIYFQSNVDETINVKFSVAELN